MQSKLVRHIEMLLWWAGAGLVVAGLVFGIAQISIGLPPGFLIGIGAVLIGFNILIGGDIIAGPKTRTFSAKGAVARGEAQINAGLCDLVIGVGSVERIATVHYGPLGKPDLAIEDGIAKLVMKNSFPSPNITRWQARLATNVLWIIEAESSLGHMWFDLSALRLERVQAYSSLGNIYLTCPSRGFTQLDLSTKSGKIELHIPAETGTIIHIENGEEAQLDFINKRIEYYNDSTYVTTNYETSDTQVEVFIRVESGTLRII